METLILFFVFAGCAAVLVTIVIDLTVGIDNIMLGRKPAPAVPTARSLGEFAHLPPPPCVFDPYLNPPVLSA
jgi:hypothetical protein